MAATPTPIHVVFDVEIDASGSVNVFAKAAQAIDNVIVSAGSLAKEILYTDASNSHIKFQGWSALGNVEDISGVRHNTSAVTKNAAVSNQQYKLGSLIKNGWDCSGAAPFSSYAGTGVSQYYTYGSFGAAMLGAYAHYLFGHVQATAAIDNDQAFVTAMDSEGATDAKVASRLLAALDAMDEAACTKVARQVIGQDASRAQLVDNDAATPGNYQALKFIADDIVYMRVKLLTPTVTVGGNSRSDVAAPDSGNVQKGEPIANKYTDAVTAAGLLTTGASKNVYTLRMKLI